MSWTNRMAGFTHDEVMGGSNVMLRLIEIRSDNNGDCEQRLCLLRGERVERN